MAFWLYQMKDEDWPPEEYRSEVWENNNTTWKSKKITTPSNLRPGVGDTIVFCYTKTNSDPGIYGWAVQLKQFNDYDIYFRPAPPSDYLKMNPLWNKKVEDIITQIRGGFNQGTMWEIPTPLIRQIRELISQY